MNWQVVYPVSVSEEQLRQELLSANSLQNLIAKIIADLMSNKERMI